MDCKVRFIPLLLLFHSCIHQARLCYTVGHTCRFSTLLVPFESLLSLLSNESRNVENRHVLQYLELGLYLAHMGVASYSYMYQIFSISVQIALVLGSFESSICMRLSEPKGVAIRADLAVIYVVCTAYTQT